jgi:hypothetical protein
VGDAAVKHTKQTSVTGGTARGAVAGAATGATLGSIVPGVGTAVGAGVGAGVGGVAGGVSAKRAKDAARSYSNAHRLLVAEFVICIIVLAFTPLTATEPIAAKDWMKRGTAMCGLFLVLGLMGAGSAAMARVSAAFGGLVTVALLVDQRSIFVKIAERFNSTAAPKPEEEAPVGEPQQSPSRPGEAPTGQPQQGRERFSEPQQTLRGR